MLRYAALPAAMALFAGCGSDSGTTWILDRGWSGMEALELDHSAPGCAGFFAAHPPVRSFWISMEIVLPPSFRINAPAAHFRADRNSYTLGRLEAYP